MTKLQQLAADMRHIIDTTGAAYCHHKLSRGLEIVLQRTGRRYRLALGRTDTAPSDTEIELCMAAFNVPAGAEPHHVVKIRQGKTGKLIYHVAELTWTEQEQSHAA